jgi:ADP-ribose pyrophosphatase YjhB (NUDIX family)
MTPVAPHAHVVVRTAADEVILVRRVRNGRVYYLAPGVEVAADETPGGAAERVAREELGLEVEIEIEEMLYAQVFAGVDHFFFLATTPSELVVEGIVADHDDLELEAESGGSHELARLPVRALLGYDVRPRALALRVVRAG